MSEVFKNFKSGEKKLTTAVTHKEWKITKANSGSYGFGHFPECNFASNINFNPQDPNFGNNTIESTIDGASGIGTQTQYKKLIHDSIHHLYIRGNDNPYDVFCNDTPHLDYREEHGSVHVFSIPSSIFGERIKPGSVTISSSFYHVKDDGYGNLYDPILEIYHRRACCIYHSLMVIGICQTMQYLLLTFQKLYRYHI